MRWTLSWVNVSPRRCRPASTNFERSRFGEATKSLSRSSTGSIPDPANTTTDVVMIGNGFAAGDPVINQAGPGNDCATSPPSPCGFFWGTPKIIRWATNQIQALEPDFTFSGNPYTTESFATEFDRNLPTPHESQVANGDSGAAVFIKNAGSWELAGILHARTVFGPANSAVYGDRSFAADLSFYRDQIVTVLLPEPDATLGLAACLATLALLHRRRQRRRVRPCVLDS